MTSQWVNFVQRRMSENVQLWQRLTTSKTPSDMWSAYSNFWQVAAEDYWKQTAGVTQMMTKARRA